ncbi:MAG: dihydroorotase [Hungatella sp.]|nr:dihydroorotase [Hungatella sp.]
MILIHGGCVIDPENKSQRVADVVIEDGKIRGIGVFDNDGTYDQVIEASGLVVAPGLVDVHVHFRDPGLTYKEDIHTGAGAAAAGGFTTVVCMANTKPPVDSLKTLNHVIEEGKKTGIHVLAASAVTVGMKGEELVDMKALHEAGAAGFTDDGIPLMDEELLERAMRQAAVMNVPISLHEEDPSYIKENGINHGAVSDKLGIYGSPARAEETLIQRDILFALRTGAKVNIQHISSAGGVDMVRQAKRMGGAVWAEVTPHHFTLTEEAVLRYGTLAKMNPPLRTEEDRQALIRGLQDGTIDMIATDHAPHSKEEKDRPLTQAPSGITGLETSLALGITELVDKKYLTMPELMEKMSLNPARLYNLDCGRMKAGAPADLVIFDPDEEFTVDKFHSKADNSPFKGWKLKGKTRYTICEGKVVYQRENL